MRREEKEKIRKKRRTEKREERNATTPHIFSLSLRLFPLLHPLHFSNPSASHTCPHSFILLYSHVYPYTYKSLSPHTQLPTKKKKKRGGTDKHPTIRKRSSLFLQHLQTPSSQHKENRKKEKKPGLSKIKYFSSSPFYSLQEIKEEEEKGGTDKLSNKHNFSKYSPVLLQQTGTEKQQRNRFTDHKHKHETQTQRQTTNQTPSIHIWTN